GLRVWMGSVPGVGATGSGGFQGDRLGDLRRVSDEGVVFRSPYDGRELSLTPEQVVDLQQRLGSDLWMMLDEPSAYPVTHAEARRQLMRTHHWAERAREHYERKPRSGALFGIVQGSVYPDLRETSARFMVALDFHGYAIGGLALGEPSVERNRVLDVVVPHLPEDRPRYVMGVGYPEDLVDAVERGVDLFDCVLPTRNARKGTLFTREGRINLRNAQYREDPRPLDPTCDCPVCRRYSRAYLRHLLRAGEPAAPRLLTLHNLHFYLRLMEEMRAAIRDGTFHTWKQTFPRGRWSKEEQHVGPTV
ncbi:MAG: tRNA guanosine(34) transglycosylase Tgt, partial [Candidatus Hydrothermae bacterium]|nr:tRNA guanosine(34) transglycosylase Tgt [Candidatus Hydrothermae bacterium]